MTPQEQQKMTAAAISGARHAVAEQAQYAAQDAVAAFFKATGKKALIIGGIVLAVGAVAAGAYSLGVGNRGTERPEKRATAKCADGTWSYARSRSGACAGHGGVKVFYK